MAQMMPICAALESAVQRWPRVGSGAGGLRSSWAMADLADLLLRGFSTTGP